MTRLGATSRAMRALWFFSSFAVACGDPADPEQGDALDAGDDASSASDSDPAPIMDAGRDASEEQGGLDADLVADAQAMPDAEATDAEAPTDADVGSDAGDSGGASEACAAGSWSATGSVPCTPHSAACAAGSVQIQAPSKTADRICDACDQGLYCAGGAAAAIDCGASTSFDADLNPSTPCQARSNCAAGTRVQSVGSATTDRTCTNCAAGTFSNVVNSAACTAWKTCALGTITAGSSTAQPVCVEQWVRQFGSTSVDRGTAIALDPSGNVLVVGLAFAALPGQTAIGSYDGFVRKYDSAGTVLWTRQFGTTDSDEPLAVGTDGSGNVFVAGNTSGVMAGATSAGKGDVFVRKYAANGDVSWTRQFGSSEGETGSSLAVMSDGSVVVAGFTNGSLPGQTAIGTTDAFVRRYASDGTESWIRQFGTTTADTGRVVTVDADDNVFVAGETVGTLPTQTNAGGGDAFVTKFNSAGTVQWNRMFGTAESDSTGGIRADANGNVVVVGLTNGTLSGQTHTGDADVFVRKIEGDGDHVWTRQFGSSAFDAASAVSVDSSGDVLVAGYTEGALTSASSAGSYDAFVRRYDSAGTLEWTRQFGTGQGDIALGIVSSGALYFTGHTGGALPTQSSAGYSDVIVGRLTP